MSERIRDQSCTATRHMTVGAYRAVGCRCPEVVERMRAQWRRDYHGRYIRRGRQPHTRRERQPPDVDEVAVLRAMQGERIQLNSAERREAVRQLTRRGYSARQVANVLHVARRTVFRHLAAAA